MVAVLHTNKLGLTVLAHIQAETVVPPPQQLDLLDVDADFRIRLLVVLRFLKRSPQLLVDSQRQPLVDFVIEVETDGVEPIPGPCPCLGRALVANLDAVFAHYSRQHVTGRAVA